ncbi:hypothetical protein R5R35_000033 [Gryllus longicercus]|uniref:MARVEL domain-containing protein n=1 Tax=Gryllus longicercus TaxID=2509291 RepID=A0AAN9VHG3_9ORTH
MADFKNYTRPPFLIKVLELALGCACMALTAGKGSATSGDKQEVVHATYYGFFIVICVVVISYLLDAPIHGKLMMVIAAAGAILYITAGALNLEYHNKFVKDDKVLAAGILGLVNGVVHLVDVFLSWRG